MEFATVKIWLGAGKDSHFIEKRLPSNVKFVELQSRLEMATGITMDEMEVSLVDNINKPVKCVKDYGLTLLDIIGKDENLGLRVICLTKSQITGQQLVSEQDVEKYVMPDCEYDKRPDTVRTYLKEHKLGRYADDKNTKTNNNIVQVSVGEVVKVAEPGKHDRVGVVKFFGKVGDADMVGVEFATPVGNMDGVFNGKQYFACRTNYGCMAEARYVTHTEQVDLVNSLPEEF